MTRFTKPYRAGTRLGDPGFISVRFGQEGCDLGEDFHTIVFDHGCLIRREGPVHGDGGKNVLTGGGERLDFFGKLHGDVTILSSYQVSGEDPFGLSFYRSRRGILSFAACRFGCRLSRTTVSNLF